MILKKHTGDLVGTPPSNVPGREDKLFQDVPSRGEISDFQGGSVHDAGLDETLQYATEGLQT